MIELAHAEEQARPGGRVVGFNDNVRRPPRPGESLAKYGLERTVERPLREGSPIRYRITNPDGQWVEFDNYYLQPATYEAAMRNARIHGLRMGGCADGPGRIGKLLLGRLEGASTVHRILCLERHAWMRRLLTSK